MADTVIKIDSICKAFEARRVLRDVSFTVSDGSSVFVCGINGAGKSTLLRIIAGLLQSDEGTVEICGYDIEKEPEQSRALLGVISHKSMVYSDLTVFENLLFFANLYGVKSPAERVEELINDVGLAPYRYDRAAILSRGLLQRLAITRALVHNPTVLLADEPFTGLDKEACEHLIAALDKFSQGGGTIMMTTHDVNFGLRCCDRVIVLDKAGLILDSPTADIDPNEFANDYIAFARKSS